MGNQPNIHRKFRHVTPTELLAQELEKHASRLSNEYTPVSDNKKWYDHGVRGDNNGGWKTLLCIRAERHLPDQNPENLQRRLFSITNREYPTTHITIADAFLLAAGIKIEDTDLPTLPWNMRAAIETVTVEAELNEKSLSPAQIEKKAKKLLERAEITVRKVTFHPGKSRNGVRRNTSLKRGYTSAA